MAGSVAVPGFGAHLANGGTTGVTYTNVAQLKTIKFSAGQIKTDDITNLDSPTVSIGSPPVAGAVYQEFIKTMVEAKDAALEGVLNPADPSTQHLLVGLQSSPTNSLEYWKITTADGSTFTFLGYSNEFSFDIAYDKALIFRGGVKISGPVTAVWS